MANVRDTLPTLRERGTESFAGEFTIKANTIRARQFDLGLVLLQIVPNGDYGFVLGRGQVGRSSVPVELTRSDTTCCALVFERYCWSKMLRFW